jgi:mono/diheme cytochrome c family protein
LTLLVALTATGARAQQDLDAGKSGAQLFAQDCASCHRSPQGLSKTMSGGALVSFLKEHYTSSSSSAGLVAAYVQGAGPGRPDRQKSREEARPATPPAATPPHERSKLVHPADSAAPQPAGEPAHAARPHDRVARPTDASVEPQGRHSRKSRRGAPTAEPVTSPASPPAPGPSAAAPGAGGGEPAPAAAAPAVQSAAPNAAEAAPPTPHAAHQEPAASAAPSAFSAPLP